MSVKPCFIIGGTDYIGSILMDGMDYSDGKMNTDDSGRTLDGYMHLSVVDEKLSVDISLCPVSVSTYASLRAALKPDTVNITLLDDETGTQTTRTFYGTSIKASLRGWAVPMYVGGKFTVIEV